jgi:predicted DNA-binding transcriptional regulator AlpA
VTEPLLTAADLAELLGFSASTILDRWEAGDLPGFRLFRGVDTRGRPTGAVRFRPSEILDWLEGQREGPDAGGDVRPTPGPRPTEELVSHLRPTSTGGDEDG